MYAALENEPLIAAPPAGRVEAKFLIPEALGDAVEACVRPFTMHDPYAGGARSYPVVSMYLDSPGMKLYKDSARGLKNRFKLRVRHYEDWKDGLVFFEIKRRLGDIIRKERAGVPSSRLRPFLKGDWSGLQEDDAPGVAEKESLYQFRALQELLAAEPRVVVRYVRTAFVGAEDPSLRITLDRALSCYPCENLDDFLRPDVSRFYKAWDIPIVLEIKFNAAFPFWVGDLVRRFGLHRQAFAKYLVCVDELRKWGIEAGGLGGAA